MILLGSCQHKDLYFGDHNQLVEVGIHWKDGVTPPKKGMRAEFFAQDERSPEIGTWDFSSPYGGKLWLLPLSKYSVICYDYLGSEVNKIRNNRDYDQIQVYTNGNSRSSYSKAHPEELLVTQPDPFFMGKVDNYIVEEPWRLDLYTTNRVKTYTFEIRGVNGAGWITSIGGACSGLSASYFLGQERVVGDQCTVIFGAEKDRENNRIIGSFRTFGHCGDDSVPNYFTIEIRYPSGDPDNGYKTYRWDISDRIHDREEHFVFEWNIDVIPTGGSGSGFDVNVRPWDEVWIPMEL